MNPICPLSRFVFAFLLAAIPLFCNQAFGALPTGTNAARQLQLASELAAQKSNAFAYAAIQNGRRVIAKGTFPGMIQERQIHVVLAGKGQGQGIAEDSNTGQTIHYGGKETQVTF